MSRLSLTEQILAFLAIHPHVSEVAFHTVPDFEGLHIEYRVADVDADPQEVRKLKRIVTLDDLQQRVGGWDAALAMDIQRMQQAWIRDPRNVG